MMFKKPKRNVSALIDVDYNQDCCGDDDNINFAKIGDSTKRLEYDYEGGD